MPVGDVAARGLDALAEQCLRGACVGLGLGLGLGFELGLGLGFGLGCAVLAWCLRRDRQGRRHCTHLG